MALPLSQPSSAPRLTYAVATLISSPEYADFENFRRTFTDYSIRLLADIVVRISLSPKGNMGKLLIHISYDRTVHVLSCSSLKELKYLQQIFQTFMPGKCDYHQHYLAIDWCFVW